MSEPKIIRENRVETKAYRSEIMRTFVVDRLPEPLTPAEYHVQIFDNYIPNTDIRLRSVRDPKHLSWTSCLEKRLPGEAGFSVAKIDLTKAEYEAFERFEGREIRKNRYFLEVGEQLFEFDVFLGKLWGLNLLTVRFDSQVAADEFERPEYTVVEVTLEPFFDGVQLVDANLEKMREEMARLLDEE